MLLSSRRFSSNQELNSSFASVNTYIGFLEFRMFFATLTSGRVAQLFDLKESKLRDLESRGLLNPLRSKENTGQRQYTPNELEKLAVIKELIDEGGYAPGDIPDNIYDIWNSISGLNG